MPGPRVLRCDGPICEHKLFFPKDWQPPNPAALSVCRESRAIALKRYKLCFGTTNIYADLPGGDIVHLNDPVLNLEWDETSTTKRNGRTHRTTPVRKKLCDDVIGDLAAITHVTLPSQVWHRSVSLDVSSLDGSYFKWGLRELKSLARVSLASVKSSDPNRAFVGHNTVSELAQQSPIELDSETRRRLENAFVTLRGYSPEKEAIDAWSARRQDILFDPVATSFMSGFDFGEDENKCIPEVRVVDLEYVAYMPLIVEEIYRGYPTQWCCEEDSSEEQEEEQPRLNARYNLRRA